MEAAWLAIPACLIWLGILVLPWRPWSTREYLEATTATPADLSNLTVLIPARNEAHTITATLASVARQGSGHRIILVDDQSTDRTAPIATDSGTPGLTVCRGQAPPPGWTGKLWALEQGRRLCDTPYLLLLDADIELLPGIIPAMLDKLTSESLQLLSLMARLRMETFWERLLMPAFIYFFKLLYPFHLSNSGSRYVRAAAGGCVLLDSRMLAACGGFEPIRGALIDDCALAGLLREHGGKTWIGLTHGACSRREYDTLGVIWDMVARCAYTQLRHSAPLLLFCSAIMLTAFVLPVLALLTLELPAVITGLLALGLMVSTYLPVLDYYDLSRLWALLLPVIAPLYLLMTWSSAIRHWRGMGAVWKGRAYPGRTGRA